ncbi:unnamed protein product [Cladocopium goreaui]|uniref:Protein-ribulosamine 3-kinase n=1 Tax=Cladocopium goreaui TaxID=2562237 RepID=A0A9P1CQJ3_9DINO|nr:unnamed protein product [Cladocopium goreaui]
MRDAVFPGWQNQKSINQLVNVKSKISQRARWEPQEPLTGSPQSRKRHSALMEELLEKMEALQSKISSDEDPTQLRPFLEPVAVEPIVRPPPLAAEPLTHEASARTASPRRRVVKSMGNWTVEARIAQQLAEKLAAEVRLFGTVIPDMKNFHEVVESEGRVPRHFLVSGLMERHELEAAFRRLDIFATPQDIDRFVSSPLALKELKQRFRQAIQTRRQRLYRPANAGPGGRVVPPRSLSPAKVVRDVKTSPPWPFVPRIRS